MTHDDILRMAREAGFMVVSEGAPETGAWYECFTDEIERFAALVAAAEREACAKACEERSMVKGGEVFAAKIRKRGETK